MTDAAWERIDPLLPQVDGRGRPWRDHRQVVNGVLWRLRTGAPWRDLPERYGPWQTVYEQRQRCGGEYAVLPVHEDGRLGPVSHMVRNTGSGPHARQEPSHPHAVVFDPRGRFLATADLGVDKAKVLWLAEGRLERVSEVPVPGIGVRGANLHRRPLRLSPPALHRRNRPASR